MFLLIPYFERRNMLDALKFTFHNVSINSRIVAIAGRIDINLHSTMFLLIPVT